MTGALSHHRLLLPVGLENQFFLVTEKLASKDGYAFRMDDRALLFLAQEVISQGAVSIILDPFSAFDKGRRYLAHPLRRRIKRVDRHLRVHSQVKRVMQPICDELGIDLTDTSLMMHSFVSPLVQTLLEETDERRKTLIDSVFVLYVSLYHLMLGMKHKAQVDIDLHHTWGSLQRLRLHCRSPESITNISFVASILRVYKIETIGELRPRSGYDVEILIDSFNDFIEDETFRQLSIERNFLGVPAYAKRSLAAIRRLGRELAQAKLFRAVFKYSASSVALATHIPNPSSEIGDAILSNVEGYLPPIAPLEDHVTKARNQWADHHGEYGTLVFGSPIPLKKPPLAYLSKSFENGVFVVSFDVFSFLENFQFTALPESTDLQVHGAFERHIRAKEPTHCAMHRGMIGPGEVTVEWSNASVKFYVRGCCEAGAMNALAYFLGSP